MAVTADVFCNTGTIFKAVTAGVFYKSILFVLTLIPAVCYYIRNVLLLQLPIGMLH